MKKWNILNTQKVENGKWKVEDIASLVLKNRGLTASKEIEEFLHPSLEIVMNDLMGIDEKEIKKAIKRIKKAITDKESIVVYTDYDVDGICAGTIMWETLYGLGAKVMPYVPHRVEEGYGLSIKGINQVKKEFDADLIITVDHGIVASEKVDHAKSLGIDVIISDHHHLPEILPKADAIVHTTELCGTGVAWVLCRELKKALRVDKEDNHLELVALATIADLVSLLGPNRILVKYGLESLNHTKRIGLLALFEEAGLSMGGIGVYEVGHMIAPRINAVGRLTHAIDAMRLLCTKDAVRSSELAKKLSFTNKERQDLTEQTLIHARDLFKASMSEGILSKLIILHHESYAQGVIGLVAGKMVEEYYRPTIVLSEGVEYSKASARSIAGFNIIEAIRKCSDLLVDCGGHPMAAGFTVKTSQLALLKERLLEVANQELIDETFERILAIDCELPLEVVTFELLDKIKMFEPFGIGNREPVFASRNVTIGEVRKIGVGGKHIKFTIPEYDIEAIGFGMSQFHPTLSSPDTVDIAYTIDKNTWNGRTQLQLKLRDVIPLRIQNH